MVAKVFDNSSSLVKMNSLGVLENFIADVNKAFSIDELFSCLREHIVRLGFERFTYELMWSDDLKKRKPLFITSYPSDWINRYIEKKYAADDMVCRYSAQVISPFAWSDISRSPNLTNAQRLVFSEASELGLSSGGTVPIHGPGSAKAYLAVVNSMQDEEFIKFFAERRHELHLIATYAHERIFSFDILDSPAPTVNLTPREIEILTWVARGKTRWEISELLAIAEETVKEHIANTCKKLKVANKTHATAVALIQGLIAP